MVQGWARRIVRRWSWEGISVAIAVKVAVAVFVYFKVPYTIDEAGEVSVWSFHTLIHAYAYVSLYYKRALQTYNAKAHWSGDRLQESGPHCVSSIFYLPFRMFILMVSKRWFAHVLWFLFMLQPLTLSQNLIRPILKGSDSPFLFRKALLQMRLKCSKWQFSDIGIRA